MSDASRFRRIDELFKAARRLPVPERASYLDAECGDDRELRSEVESLLAADAWPTGELDRPAIGEPMRLTDFDAIQAAAGPHMLSSDEPLPESIGPYRVLRQIGEGGMGVVYEAEQTEPVRRRVALKIIKLGMDTKQVIGRFETERQALALMDHPNIARVLDAGSTETGRPYFVMELVKGVPITAYCDRNNLSTRDRLALFISVCRAAQHAHQKGVIHRDLKPSNVLVSDQEGPATAKVIDFGIAKATDHRLTEKTVFTAFGQFIGTPEYMSPEQAEMSELDVDTRTDVYSLGVLLYELLTGMTPFDTGTLRSAAYGEIQRIIREVEPPKPSTKLSGEGTERGRDEGSDGGSVSSIEEIARRRRSDPTSLKRQVRGDLDWIVMKALEKDRTRRYETASALAEDVERHLRSEPVAAGPPSASYRFGKFARRNRAALVTLSAVAAALVFGLTAATWGFVEARNQRDAAQTAQRDEVRQRSAAERARADVERERARAVEAETLADERRREADDSRMTAETARDESEEVTQFLVDMLAAVRPSKMGRDVTMHEVLDEASRDVDARLDERPLVAAAIHKTIGDTYERLGRFDSALPHVERAVELFEAGVGPEHPDSLRARCALGLVRHDLGLTREAETTTREVLELQRRVLGPDHVDTLQSMQHLTRTLQELARFDEAETLGLQTLEARRRVQGEEAPATLTAMNTLALTYRNQGRYDEAAALYEQVLDIRRRTLGPRHRSTLTTLNNMATLHNTRNRPDLSEPIYREVIEIRRETLGPDHPHVILARGNLASALRGLGRFDEAERELAEVTSLADQVMGPTHPTTMRVRANFASLLQDLDRHDEAEQLMRETVEQLTATAGRRHQDTIVAMNNLAVFYSKRGRYEEAEPIYLEAIEIQRETMGADHPNTLRYVNSLAYLYEFQDRFDEAERLYLQVIDGLVRTLGEDEPQTVLTRYNLGASYLSRERYDDALAVLERSAAGAERAFPPGHRFLGGIQQGLGQARLRTGDLEGAEEALLSAWPVALEALAPDDERRIELINLIVEVYESLGRKEDAEEWREKLP